MDPSLYENGHYQILLENLQKVKQQGGSSECGRVAQQLTLINDQAVCRYLMGKSAEERKGCSLEFVDVLKKCRSIAAGEEIVCVELCSLYNFIYCLSETSCSIDRSVQVMDMYSQAYTTFYRVCRMLSQQKRMEDVRQHKDIKTDSRAMLNNILEKLQYGTETERLTMSVCRCVLLLAVHEMKNDINSATYKLLEETQLVLRNIETGVSKQPALCLPLRIEHSQLHLTSKANTDDIVFLLIGVCLCKSHAWDEAYKVLKEISTQQTRCLAQFCCGFTLFKSGKYAESISGLLEVLRSGHSLTQKLKARVYNLIGNCFDKLNKCQLSRQMFKEALCADFSYLVPLYNTSLQYRNQGVNDMELECLNLLVTAISMREKYESCYDSMDLICLFDTEDNDVPYIKALYSLSLRSLQLKRFDVAAEKYVSLLDHLRLWKADTKEIMSCIPPLLQVHHEAIEALLMSKKYVDCVSLCDRTLLCYQHNMSSLADLSVLSQTLDQTASQGSAADSQTETGKRKFDDLSQSQEEEHFGDVDVIALKYKAMALVKMGDNSGGLVCLERAIHSITSYRKFRLNQKMRAVTQYAEPRKKRQKLDETSSTSTNTSTNSLLESDDKLAGTSADTREGLHSDENICDKRSVMTELLQDCSGMLELEQDLYEMTAGVLASMEKDSDSVHYKQLASQTQLIKQKL